MRTSLLLLVLAAARAQAGSLDDLAGEIARRAAPEATGAAALAVRAGEPQLARLADTLGGLVAARLEGSTRFAAGPAAARGAGFARLVEVELALDGAEVTAVGRILDVEHDVWRDAARGPAAPAIAASFVARARLDGELRAHLGATLPVSPPPTTARPRRWSFRPLPGAVDLGAPLLAAVTADLDGDGRAELIALTTDELIALHVTAEGASVLARTRLEGAPPAPRPRFAVGTLVAVADPGSPLQLRARSSEHGGGSFGWQAGMLVRTADAGEFPTCTGPARLVPGVALFAGAVPPFPEKYLAAGCSGGLVAVLDPGGTLRLHRPGERVARSTLPGIGTAFLVDDLDGDGVAELVAAAYRAPATGDQLTVWRLGADGAAQRLRKPTSLAAGVVALAAGDLDGDGALDVVAVARQPGATQVELWLLE